MFKKWRGIIWKGINYLGQHRILQPVPNSFIISCASGEADSAAFSKDADLEIQMLWMMCLSFQKSLRFIYHPLHSLHFPLFWGDAL